MGLMLAEEGLERLYQRFTLDCHRQDLQKHINQARVAVQQQSDPRRFC